MLTIATTVSAIRKSFLPVLPLLFLLALFVPSAVGAPAVSTIRGRVSDGSVVTIEGSGFGVTGPNVVLFDDYEKGKDGSAISTAPGSARVGQWTTAVGGITYSTAYAHSGRKAARSEWANAGAGRIPQTQLNFPGSAKVFLSWWQYLPADKDVPGTNNPDRANWKLFWLWSDPFPGSDYLTVLLGLSSYLMGADDLAPPRRYTSRYLRTKFARGNWIRYQFCFQGGQTDGAIEYAELTDSGLATLIDAEHLNTIREGNLWNRLTIPGYGRRDHNSQTYVDDVYVAVGPGARARVEIGDRPSYDRCGRLALATPLSWTNERVTATVRRSGFTPGETAYLFVIDSNGGVSPGFPIVIEESSDAGTGAMASPGRTGSGK